MKDSARPDQIAEEPVDESLWHGALGVEGEDDAPVGLLRRRPEKFAPAPIALRHESRRAEGVGAENFVDDEMVVVEFAVGERSEFAADRVFAARGRPVEEDEFHGQPNCTSRRTASRR